MSEESCFVLMPFSADMQAVYNDAIKPAVEGEGLVCVRADEIPGTGNIVRRVIDHIMSAKVIVADLTGKNANVFYELGIAHALGNNVVMLAQDIKRDVPFDVASYKVIEYRLGWRGDVALQDEIRSALRTLGDWSKKPSNPVQDFLPPEKRPVSRSTYLQVCGSLEETKVQLEAYGGKNLESIALREELQLLRNENARLSFLHFTPAEGTRDAKGSESQTISTEGTRAEQNHKIQFRRVSPNTL